MATRAHWSGSIKIHRKHKIMVKGYAMIFGDLMSYMFSPLLDPKSHSKTQHVWYTIHRNLNPIIELVYVSQLTTEVSVDVSVSVFDSVFGVLIFHACGHAMRFF